MDDQAFIKSIDRTRLDRLEGEIIASLSEYENQGYHNMEIARTLVRIGFERTHRETQSNRESFLHFVRDLASKNLATMAQITEDWLRRREKQKWN